MSKTAGQVGFEAYGDTALPVPWKTFDGRDMPRWEDPSPHMIETRRRWEVSAAAILASGASVGVTERPPAPTPDARWDVFENRWIVPRQPGEPRGKAITFTGDRG